jgi:hypothetical protein
MIISFFWGVARGASVIVARFSAIVIVIVILTNPKLSQDATGSLARILHRLRSSSQATVLLSS